MEVIVKKDVGRRLSPSLGGKVLSCGGDCH
jgi:hypothetical protein